MSFKLNENESPRDSLIREAEHFRYLVAKSASLYGIVYIGSRVILIGLASIVAAQNNLKGSPAAFIVAWVPILALIVAVLTAIDTWLKPGVRWKQTAKGSIDIARLRDSIRSTAPTDIEEIGKLNDQFRKMQKDMFEDHLGNI